MTTEYQKLNIDLEMGTKYLINESAYFLGGIFAANESVESKNVKYWIAPVRHNVGHITNEELEEHFLHVKVISAKLANQTLMAHTIKSNGLNSGKFSRLPGFGTFFESKGKSEVVDFIPAVRDALFNSSEEVKRCFIVGMFDGRGSFDKNSKTGVVRHVVLDCDNRIVGYFLKEVLNNYGLEYNYNEARERKEGGKERQDQLRIRGKEKYVEKIGFISKKKFEVGAKSYNIPNEFIVKHENGILYGLKKLEKSR